MIKYKRPVFGQANVDFQDEDENNLIDVDMLHLDTI